MENKTKKSIIGLILTGIIGGVILTGGGIVCLDVPGQDCIWLTKKQYKDLKLEMTGKYLLGQEFTWQEYQLLVAILNREAKQRKFKGMKEITEENLVRKMINKITE